MLNVDSIVGIMNNLGFTEESLTTVLAGVKLQIELASLQSQMRNLIANAATAQAEVEAQRQALQSDINAKQAEIDALQS